MGPQYKSVHHCGLSVIASNLQLVDGVLATDVRTQWITEYQQATPIHALHLASSKGPAKLCVASKAIF